MTAEHDALRDHLLSRSVGASCGGVLTFPMILIPHDRYLGVKAGYSSARRKRDRTPPTAEVVLQILRDLGLRGERVRKDTEGVVGLFRRLLSPPPWEEVHIEDVVDGLTSERAQALTPLCRLVQPEADLVERYRQVLIQQTRESQSFRDPLPALLAAVDSATLQWRLDDFVEKLRLARALGPDNVEKLADAVFGPKGDEFSAAPGVPDLFVWDTDRDEAGWFFAEVKGPRDHLQESQRTWLREHWDTIDGRFAVISVG